MADTVFPDFALTAQDRCDRCGAQAYVKVELVDGDLLFCGHHSREHLPKLKEIAVSIHDETDKLAEQEDEACAGT